jgi:hypothetical protein
MIQTTRRRASFKIMTLDEQIKAMESMKRTAETVTQKECATYYAAAAAIAAAITIRAKEEPTPAPIENHQANSLAPHSVWAVWNEDATEVIAWEMDKEDAERSALNLANAGHSGHVAEYFLTRSETIGGGHPLKS